MTTKFGQTSHSDIARAFEAENRQHTFVEQPEPGVHVKKYQLRVTQEELLTLLDALARDSMLIDVAAKNELRILGERVGANHALLQVRQLRAKILATLGLFED